MQPALNSALNPRSQNKAEGLHRVTPQGYLTSFTRILMTHAQNGHVKAFEHYVNSQAFIDALKGMDLKRRQSAMATFHKAAAICRRKAYAQPIVEATGGRGSEGGKGRWNNPVMLARLRNAYAKAGTDEGAARLLGVSPGAARLAKRRYLTDAVELNVAA